MNLAMLFQTVAERLGQERAALNAADPYNGNHGDHMVAIFRLASQAAVQPDGESSLAEAMGWAASQLARLDANGSAQVYAHGLAQFAREFRQRNIGLDDLSFYIRRAIAENGGAPGEKVESRRDLLKALISGLAGWQAVENGASPDEYKTPDLGYLFDLGVAYMQAKTRSENKIEALAEAAVTTSPLARVPHRIQSGKLALQTLLAAIAVTD
jgi:hypothetical protein